MKVLLIRWGSREEPKTFSLKGLEDELRVEDELRMDCDLNEVSSRFVPIVKGTFFGPCSILPSGWCQLDHGPFCGVNVDLVLTIVYEVWQVQQGVWTHAGKRETGVVHAWWVLFWEALRFRIQGASHARVVTV